MNHASYCNVYISRPTRCTNSYNESLLIIIRICASSWSTYIHLYADVVTSNKYSTIMSAKQFEFYRCVHLAKFFSPFMCWSCKETYEFNVFNTDSGRY